MESIQQVLMPDSTRNPLVTAAMELFRKKGYGSTSVADLLEAGGASRESLHGVFPDKKDLLVAVLDAYRRDIPATLLEPAWRDVTDPIERIFSLLGRYRQ